MVSVSDFVFGKYWYPTDDPAAFGIFPLIIASVAVTLVSSVISIPLGVLTALYLAEGASARVREWVKPIVELLAALPSVVIGFFGMVIVAPVLQEVLNIPHRSQPLQCLPDAGFYVHPNHLQPFGDAIFGVPVELKEASFGIGGHPLGDHCTGHFPGIHFRNMHRRYLRDVKGHGRNHGCAHGCGWCRHDPYISV